MRLLRALTLIYTAILVSALGASLGAIWIYLRRVANVLGEVRAALAQVRDETVPLGEHLRGLHDASVASGEDLTETRGRLARADERLAEIAERLGQLRARR